MNIRRTHVAVVISSLLSLFLFGFALHAQEFSAPQPTPSESIPELVRGINVTRLEAGLEPVVHNPTLEAMAAMQADFLVSQPTIDFANIHRGAQGESARERSQFPQFTWATYGHPAKFQVSEIAAVGNVDYAISYWRTSDLHSRSIHNHNYREIGVAARQLGSDTLYIVVLGGRPNTLPALVGFQGDVLYLTNERNTWQGDWMGEAVMYRLLDADQEPITDWQPWQLTTDVPDLDGDFFYVEYEDADANRVLTQVPFQPRWYANQTIISANDVAEDSASETEDASVQESAADDDSAVTVPEASDNTVVADDVDTDEVVISEVIVTPEPAAAIELIYSQTHFTLHNASDAPVDVLNVTFEDDDNIFEALLWERVADGLNISALPANHCLQIVGLNGSRTAEPPPECRWTRSVYWLSEEKFFWQDASFAVRHEGSTIATCEADVDRCRVALD